MKKPGTEATENLLWFKIKLTLVCSRLATYIYIFFPPCTNVWTHTIQAVNKTFSPDMHLLLYLWKYLGASVLLRGYFSSHNLNVYVDVKCLTTVI